MYTLRNGTTVEDPRLDRLVQFDERSREYPVVRSIETRVFRSNTWRIKQNYLIDQGEEGACVGFSVTNELMARPAEVKFPNLEDANEFARSAIYYEAQRNDPFPGGEYPGASPRSGGTSVLAGMQAAHELGYFKEYLWSFGLHDLCLGLAHKGPAVLGLWWYDTNYTPDSNGFIGPRGNRVGGHAILARAIKLVKLNDGLRLTWDNVDRDRSYITLRNSWGVWGHEGSGDCYVSLRDMGHWLDDDGEAVFAVARKSRP